MKLDKDFEISEEYLDKDENSRFNPKKINSKEMNFTYIKILKLLKDDPLVDKVEGAFNNKKADKEYLKKWIYSRNRKEYPFEVLNFVYNLLQR